ncbi:MAG: translesion error-prone DNA polymerase V autoproteolytic subunit [Bacteroidota bacterium]|nr:translesion error-prone DNA polymerase V autoproteolytic subunit [Bacteroidota bacterium]
MARPAKKDNITIRLLNPKKSSGNFSFPVEGFVAAGFPSPAGDYMDKELDLKELLVRNESSTFFVHVCGNSMVDAGINDGDILVVDKSLDPRDDSILVCFVDGEFTVKRVSKIDGALYLIPANPQFKPIKIDESADFRLWGVVTYMIHKFR